MLFNDGLVVDHDDCVVGQSFHCIRVFVVLCVVATTRHAISSISVVACIGGQCHHLDHAPTSQHNTTPLPHDTEPNVATMTRDDTNNVLLYRDRELLHAHGEVTVTH